MPKKYRVVKARGKILERSIRNIGKFLSNTAKSLRRPRSSKVYIAPKSKSSSSSSLRKVNEIRSASPLQARGINRTKKYRKQ
jgi:hypothetical protein